MVDRGSDVNKNCNNNDSDNADKSPSQHRDDRTETGQTSQGQSYALPPPLKDERKEQKRETSSVRDDASAALLHAFEATPPAACASTEDAVEVPQHFLNRNLGSDVSRNLTPP